MRLGNPAVTVTGTTGCGGIAVIYMELIGAVIIANKIPAAFGKKPDIAAISIIKII